MFQRLLINFRLCRSIIDDYIAYVYIFMGNLNMAENVSNEHIICKNIQDIHSRIHVIILTGGSKSLFSFHSLNNVPKK